ncbi:MAG TPA: IS4 family transposase [Thermoguttaceae bacterium]|nr:IS4 family transposase [Thermoguttaceae bacterium]
MTSLSTLRTGFKNRFSVIANPFLHDPGLPFASVLDAESIERVFREEQAFFGQDDIFSTEIVLWAFLAQTLRDGKGVACSAAVADIATYMLQTGQRPPSGDTGDYCRARAKLSLAALRRLVHEASRQLEEEVMDSWLWKGLHAKLVDGFTFTMPDTPDNQELFPQIGEQRPGVGFPIARVCAVMSLATACVCDLALGPYEGKETGENALLRGLLETFEENDVVVFDRHYCSFMMLALLSRRGLHVCARLHQRRHSDFRRGRRLGPGDHLITWTRPQKPPWMSPEQYDPIPETLTLREVQFHVTIPGRRTETLTVVTTLTDPQAYSREEIAALYGFRWNVELDIRQIKQTLHLDHVRCKTPEMVRRELWVTLLAYNLIRKVIATSAAVYEKQPRQLGFTLACQSILASWMLLSTGSCHDAGAMYHTMLAYIAANEVADRPGRIEPRVLKRRRHRYPLMQRPRHQLRAQLGKT